MFLADYFVNEAFRRELLRVLNRGESVNSLKRAIYVGRVAGWNTRPSTAVPPALIGRIAPTRTEGINLRGVFSLPSGLTLEGRGDARAHRKLYRPRLKGRFGPEDARARRDTHPI